jgi:hypothetical protein
MNNPDIQQMLVALAHRIRQKTYPFLNADRARKIEGVAHSGDVSFQLDVIAEQEIESFFHYKISDRTIGCLY